MMPSGPPAGEALRSVITKQEIIEFMETDAYRPLSVQELVERFGIEGGGGFREFIKLLNEMEEAGDVVRTRANRYGVPDRMNLVVGQLHLKARGFGFVIPEDNPGEDLYIPASELNGAMSGDKVMARVEKSAHNSNGPSREGRVIRILERANHRVVGRFTYVKGHGFVTPADKRFPQDIFISSEDTMDAHDGYAVVVEITSFPTATRGPEGKIVEVLGHPDAPGVDIQMIVRKYGLPEEFPESVLTAAERIPLELTAADYEGRTDLRDEIIVTIDGEDAKDLDDAVHVKRLENGNFLLGVHIADVGYYVKHGGVLDGEAYERGTSVYLVDRVIPMLPQRLSNNVCSLNPHVDRLTMTCEMEINNEGNVVRHAIYPSIIRTTERMTYANVRRILSENDEKTKARYAPLVPHFQLMEELALLLRDKRMRRGAIDFDFDEIKVMVDEVGRPMDIVPRQRSIAERIIEEFMLAANETVAEHFYWLGAPFVYRIHEEPSVDRMMEFNEFVHNFGYHVKGLGNNIHPRSLQDILKKAEGTREERVISTLMLRSMKQARYAPECTGHFGLAAEYYTHFTSPIRRYPDLVIHRLMREYLAAPPAGQREESLQEFVADASLQSSRRERIAQDAEREVDQLKMVEYMQAHLGEEFDGLIGGVTQFGLFIHLKSGVEGLLHISYLADDYYVFNERHMALVGERTRRVFRLGDPVRVRVAGASKADLTIDFELVTHHREGTMVYAERGGPGTVVYDEDLSPKDRRRQEERRAERASVRSPRGSRSSLTLADEGFGRGDGRRSSGAGRSRSGTKDAVGQGGPHGRRSRPGAQTSEVGTAARGGRRGVSARGRRGKPTEGQGDFLGQIGDMEPATITGGMPRRKTRGKPVGKAGGKSGSTARGKGKPGRKKAH